MATTTEISKDVYRISVFVPEINLEFSHFLVRDDEPLLFHTGLRSMFPLLREEVSRLIDISKIRHIGFSHFESDECGALNQWLELAPSAQPVCGLVGALVLFEESERTLFCSDLFHQWGHREPTTADSIMERCKDALLETEAGPFANYVPYTHHTGRVLETLAEYEPKTLAIMHGSTYYGDGAQALRDLAIVMRDVLGPKAEQGETTSIGTIKT